VNLNNVRKIFAIILVAASLAACGAGAPSTPPAYTASDFQALLNWPATSDGALGGNTALGVTDMFVTIPFRGAQYSDVGLISDQVSFGVGLAPPSPLPSAAPTLTPEPAALVQIRNNPVMWVISGPTATYTPAPQWTSLLGPTVNVNAGGIPGKSTLTATAVGPPVNVGISANVFTYRVADIGCADPGALGGASFTADSSGGNYEAQTAPSASDLYVTGPACSGSFADPSGYTVHVPYGGMLTNLDGIPGVTNNGFFTVSPAAWRSQFTQMTQAQFEAALVPCSTAANPRLCFTPENDVFLFKTSAGEVVKMYIALNHHATTSGQNITGAFEVSSGGSFPF
jgi:hypothetical protein